MLRSLTKNWWALAIKGLILVIFAILIFMNPVISATGLAIWFAILMIADGIFTILAAFASWKEREDKWLILLEGAISLFLGIILLNMPGLTLLIVGFTVAFWFIFGGISRIAMGIQVRKEIEGEGWIILGGTLSVIFGLIIASSPLLGISYIMWIIAFAALLIGIVMIIIAFKLRKGSKWLKDKVEDFKEEIDETKQKLRD
ncbi:MAG: HdeD family acid-resistance protein [Galbibacter orientalis]|uniref:HdeD family acid-resistance protein n=1 Tax=Galbibacter orientalis TaxID=453852 RepID=UPI00300387EE